ncbi:sigma-54-dependent transcriptional regulator [Allorhodopirellula heiligendammensis]|uniref:DNA-binding transcriptional regulator NtrC n=1 Tax=Allorhodopirellula heiligendammensis TaxID=2714739 RepID=A0A5C6C4A8_9BACT|nr:sigma-54 dependent transcriptional regulator [Allorhodopirellula heiligendammensis]TWU18935.1 Nitrogen regulation protein NR(I) [Allorhodopirellula heiligendammensis]
MTSQQTVLVVDDEPTICWALEKMLVGEGHRVVTASSAEEGLRLAREHSIAMVILDVRLPHMDGITALPKFLDATDNASVVIITAFGDLETAVAAVKNGASDYLTKPFKLEDALRTCRTALQKSAQRSAPTATQPMLLDRTVLVGTSPAMQQVFRQIALVADSDLSVLITGETGTGKELVAAAIARHSNRTNAAYIPIAPVALNPELIESELFGHVKGAFTGASEDRAGLFERAEGGTVLLDEIGDLALGTQAKLLRVLEQGQYSRVGDVKPRTADVRILAATNSDLHDAVASGSFREDLFHRLTGVQIHLPPLRERLDDIAPLCHHFLAAMEYADTGIDEVLLAELQQRPWHGNVRELKNAVSHAAVVARGRRLNISDFPDPKPGRDTEPVSSDRSLERVVEAWTTATLAAHPDTETLHADFLTASEPALLRVMLQHTGGNRAKAAEMLGIHRGTLRDRLRAYRID